MSVTTPASARLRSLIASLLAVAGGLMIGASPATAQNAVVEGRINPEKTTEIRVVGNPNARRLSDGGKFHLHAGAQLDGAAAPNPDIKHLPAAGQPAEANILPVGIGNPNAVLRDQRAEVVPLKNAKKYADNANNPNKNFTSPPQNRDINTSTPATKTVTAPVMAPNFPNALNTVATAEAKVFFEQDPVGVYKVSAADTVAKIEGTFQSAARVGVAGRRGPNGRVSTLVVDPLTYSNVQPGDVLRGEVGFDRDFFRAQVTDPLGLVTTIHEVGTDLLGPSPGPLGTSFENGLPLIYRLRVTVVADSAPIIEFEANPAFTFFDPLDSTETSLDTLAITPQAFVRSRFNAALDPTVLPGGVYTLTQSPRLIAYKATAPQSVSSTVRVDYLSGQVAAAGEIPEPGTSVLLGSVAVSGLAWAARRRRPQGRR